MLRLAADENSDNNIVRGLLPAQPRDGTSTAFRMPDSRVRRTMLGGPEGPVFQARNPAFIDL